MRLLLDTHIVLSVIAGRLSVDHPDVELLLLQEGALGVVSIASIWEIGIKNRIGKLDLPMPLEEIGHYLASMGINLLAIKLAHVIAEVSPQPPTRDPFDRLLLAQCSVEKMKLVTLDRSLVSHPLSATR